MFISLVELIQNASYTEPLIISIVWGQFNLLNSPKKTILTLNFKKNARFLRAVQLFVNKTEQINEDFF